jgi:protein-S-isoprenylcysteine O-methyltransferase Ste14
MTKLEEAHDKRTGSHRESAPSVETVRRKARLGAVVTCGVLLIVLGFIFNVSSSETSWVGIGTFSIASVVTVALIWRYFGKRIRGDSSHK